MSSRSEHLNSIPQEKRYYLLQMLPTHLAHAGQTERLYHLLTDFDFMESKFSTLGMQALLNDYELSNDSSLRAIQQALRKEAHHLTERPHLLWQQFYNRLQWEGEPALKLLTSKLQTRIALGGKAWLRLRVPLPESSALLRTLSGHTEDIRACTFSPDGKKVLSASLDGTLKLWDVATGAELFSIVISTEITFRAFSGTVDFAFTPDGSFFVSVDQDSMRSFLHLRSAETGQQLGTLPHGHTSTISACAFSPDGTTFVTASRDQTLKVWDTATWQERATLTGHTKAVISCVYSPDGNLILSSSSDGTLRVWDLATGRELIILQGNYSDLKHVCAFSPDGRTILSPDQSLVLWDLATRTRRLSIFTRYQSPSIGAFSPDGKFILSGGLDDTLRLWDSQTGQELAILAGHTALITDCSFSPDGSMILSGSNDHTIKLWDVQRALKAAEQTSPVAHTSWITACSFSPDGTMALSGSDDGRIKLWDVETGLLQTTIPGYTMRGASCAFDPDSAAILLATGSIEGEIVLCDVKSGQKRFTLGHAQEFAQAWAFHPHGKIIASANWRGKINLWDAETGITRAACEGSYYPMTMCNFSSDGTKLLSATSTGALQLWDVVDALTMQRQMTRWGLRASARLSGHDKRINMCCFSPDGSRILSASQDGTLKLWDEQTGQERTTLIGHHGPVEDCAFSPDGNLIISAGGQYADGTLPRDGTLKLWDAWLGIEYATLMGHTSAVNACAFSPDGTLILSAGEDYSLKLWDVKSREERAHLPLLGPLSHLALHPWRPLAVVGDRSGNIYFVDLVDVFYQSIIVTAVDKGEGPLVICPKCHQNITISKHLLNQEMICTTPGCELNLRINGFVIQAIIPETFTPEIPVTTNFPKSLSNSNDFGNSNTSAVYLPSAAWRVLPRQSEVHREEKKPLKQIAYELFELEPRFAKLRKGRLFRKFGILANLLSTLAVAILLNNFWYALFLSIFVLSIFHLCVRLVKLTSAMLCGMLIAFYWAWMSWQIESILVTKLHHLWLPSPAIVAILFFIICVYLHARYIRNRLL